VLHLQWYCWQPARHHLHHQYIFPAKLVPRKYQVPRQALQQLYQKALQQLYPKALQQLYQKALQQLYQKADKDNSHDDPDLSVCTSAYTQTHQHHHQHHHHMRSGEPAGSA